MPWKAKENLLALLDIGSHTIKLYILNVSPSKQEWKIVDSMWLPIQIGKDIFVRGSIRQETLSELNRILTRYQEVIRSYRISDIKAFITSALSEASNSESVISRCESILGVPVTIIHPHQENEAIYLAVSHITHNHPQLKHGTILTLHVGSGSSRLFLEQNGSLLLSQTYHTGILRLSQYLPSTPSAYESYFYPFVKHLQKTIQTTIGDTPLHLVLLHDDIVRMLERLGYKENHHLYLLSRQEIEKITVAFLSLPDEELVAHYSIPDTTLQTIRISLVFFLTILRQLSLSELYLPHTISTFGFAYELLHKDNEKLTTATLSSVMALAKRYQYDAEHAQKVMQYSSLLFDAMKIPFHLSEREKLYLQVAALLHDIGYFVGPTNHHKNTYDLLRHTEIFGLDPEEVLLIALIARYHRKSPPKKTHNEFVNLDIHKRILVTRLSAILRIANALDTCHMPAIRHLEVHLKDNTLSLLCHVEPKHGHAYEVIQNAVTVNKTLFENFFGIKVVIEKR